MNAREGQFYGPFGTVRLMGINRDLHQRAHVRLGKLDALVRRGRGKK